MSSDIRRVFSNLLIEGNMRVLGAFNGEVSGDTSTVSYIISSPASGKTSLAIFQGRDLNYTSSHYTETLYVLGSGSRGTKYYSGNSNTHLTNITLSVNDTTITVSGDGRYFNFSILVLEVEE